MKKIGIITILKCNNFGAELQAFATQRKLQLMGYDAEIIDLLYYKHPDFKKTKLAKPFVKLSLKTNITEFIKFSILNPIIYNVLPLFSKKLKTRNRKFDDFHKQNTELSKTYYSIDELYNSNTDYNAYIVGSDQVWNPHTGMNLEPYFLTFAPAGKRKISYASSFGVTKIEKEYAQKYTELINNLEHISVRENAGVEIIKELTGRDAELVLDPTLLLNKEEWSHYASNLNPNKDGYVLIYEVHPSERIQQLAIEYGKRNNIPVYRVGVRGFGNWKTKGITNLTDIGPTDFIALFVNASYIFTNSFHGTAFSVNLQKQFYTVLSRNGKKNSRMTSLLKVLNLGNRIIYAEDEYCAEFVDYNTIESTNLLQIERDKSIEFLTKSINE